MDTQAIRAQMPTLVVGHVPTNVRSFKFNIFDGQPKVSTLGFHIDPKPFEGKVIATTDEAIVVKTGRAEFAVLDRTLVTEVPDEGAKVQVEPYPGCCTSMALKPTVLRCRPRSTLGPACLSIF